MVEGFTLERGYQKALLEFYGAKADGIINKKAVVRSFYVIEAKELNDHCGYFVYLSIWFKYTVDGDYSECNDKPFIVIVEYVDDKTPLNAYID